MESISIKGNDMMKVSIKKTDSNYIAKMIRHNYLMMLDIKVLFAYLFSLASCGIGSFMYNPYGFIMIVMGLVFVGFGLGLQVRNSKLKKLYLENGLLAKHELVME
jgi:hypothetical protein